MKSDRMYLIFYGIYFLLLAVAWWVASEPWRGVIFGLTYTSATVAIVTFGYLLDGRRSKSS